MQRQHQLEPAAQQFRAALRLSNRRQLCLARAARREYGRISEDLQEGIAGVREIRAFSAEETRGQPVRLVAGRPAWLNLNNKEAPAVTMT